MPKHPKQPKKPTGASPLHLNPQELRRELRRADTIISNAYARLSVSDKLILAYQQNKQGITPTHDPMGAAKRRQAMHRITPKRDYIIIALTLAIAFLVLAWCASRTNNDLLRAELAHAIQATHDIQTTQTAYSETGDHHGNRNR